MQVFQALPIIKIKDIIEIAVIAFGIYQILKWVRGTRAWMLFKGIIVLFAVSAIAMVFEMNTIMWIFANTINVGIIALLIVFQPELRKALEQLGQKNFLSTLVAFDEQKDKKEKLAQEYIEEIVQACALMSKVKTGALIVLEKDVKLYEFEKTGLPVDAIVTRQILCNIFEHNTPLHDGAVIIRGNRIVAATCYLPLSENMTLSKELGTRHRAAVGISEVSDCVVVTVSEESGKMSVAMGGNLVRGVDLEYLKGKLLEIYADTPDATKFKIWKGRMKNVR
nr:diadenylate cyclase CdaA [Anaerotalea alkaliphila]